MDMINGIFEMAGGLLLIINIVKLIKDKSLSGVSVIPTVHFTVWGVWNLWYYPSLDQTWSYWGAVSIVSANTVWIVLVIVYAVRRKLTAGSYQPSAAVNFAQKTKADLIEKGKEVDIAALRQELAEAKAERDDAHKEYQDIAGKLEEAGIRYNENIQANAAFEELHASKLTAAQQREQGYVKIDKAYRFILQSVNQYRGENKFNWSEEDMLGIILHCLPDQDETIEDWLEITAALASTRTETCEWKEVRECVYEMSCGVEFTSATTPCESGFKFCPYCGKPISTPDQTGGA